MGGGGWLVYVICMRKLFDINLYSLEYHGDMYIRNVTKLD